jgi:carbon storage regulator
VLVLTRRAGESIVIGDDVRVVVLDVRGDTVRLGIEAPRSVQVHRAEVYAEVQAANAAAAAPADLDSVAGRLRRLAKPAPRSGRPSAQRAGGRPSGGSGGSGGRPPQQPGPRQSPGAPSGTPRPAPRSPRPVPQPPHQRPGPVGEVSTGTAGDPAEAHSPEDPNPSGTGERPVPRPPAHRPGPPPAPQQE